MLRNLLRLPLTALALAIWISPAALAGESPLALNPAQIVGTENCTECHAPMAEVWKRTHHFNTFYSMHRSTEARGIAERLNLRRLKEGSVCIKCHYTSRLGDDLKPHAISGVSCESCHGAGQAWHAVHGNKRDPERLVKAEQLGMIRPSNVYELASRCYACHTVPEERLVNVGGHEAGSRFEFVSWFSGEVRHNLMKSGGKVNEEMSAGSRRVFHVIGRALDLEYAVRGAARATQEGPYLQGMITRASTALKQLEQLHQLARLPELSAIIDTFKITELQANNETTLLKLAAAIGEHTRKLAANPTLGSLAEVDSLIPTSTRGKPYRP